MKKQQRRRQLRVVLILHRCCCCCDFPRESKPHTCSKEVRVTSQVYTAAAVYSIFVGCVLHIDIDSMNKERRMTNKIMTMVHFCLILVSFIVFWNGPQHLATCMTTIIILHKRCDHQTNEPNRPIRIFLRRPASFLNHRRHVTLLLLLLLIIHSPHNLFLLLLLLLLWLERTYRTLQTTRP